MHEASKEVFKIKNKICEAGLFDYFFDNGWFLPSNRLNNIKIDIYTIMVKEE